MSLNGNISVLDAITSRYLSIDNEVIEHCSIIFQGSRKVSVSDDDKKILPTHICLNDLNICNCGPTKHSDIIFDDVKELDLMKNSISEWDEIFSMLETFRNLQVLNLSENPLCDHLSPSIDFPHQLKKLILNKTGISWGNVRLLLSMLPSVEELYISLNGYQSVDIPSDFQHSSVKLLHMNETGIDDWSDICKIGCAFPNLEQLVICENNISSVNCVHDGSCFAHLGSLNLTGSKIHSWAALEPVNLFTSLVDIRLKSIQFLESIVVKQRRELTISYLPSVKVLNGSEITESERTFAERAFIRHYMTESSPPERLKKLQETHGQLNLLANVNLEPPRTVAVTIKIENKNELVHVKLNQTVGEFKKFLQQKYQIRNKKFRVIYVDRDYDDGHSSSSELIQNTVKLHSHRVHDGDEFIIWA